MIRFFSVFALGLGFSLSSWAFTPPEFSSPIVDNAGVLSPSHRDQLAFKLNEIFDRGGPQLAFLSVPSLNGYPIEQASIEVVDKWQLGTKEKDNGALIFVSVAEKKLRIEVGQGLEGDLPDLLAKEIIDKVMVPRIRAQNFDDAIEQGFGAIVTQVAPDFIGLFESEQGARSLSPLQGKKKDFGGWVIFLLMMLLVVFRHGGFQSLLGARSRRSSGFYRRRGRYDHDPFGGWGGGGFGGRGGGGFGGGGGGGFSGGGASGGW